MYTTNKTVQKTKKERTPFTRKQETKSLKNQNRVSVAKDSGTVQRLKTKNPIWKENQESTQFSLKKQKRLEILGLLKKPEKG